MFFSTIRLFIKSLLTPMVLFWLPLLAALVFYWKGRKKIAKWIFVFSFFWFLMISTPFLPKMLLATLENQNSPVQFASENGLLAAKSDSMTHILVLGSGYETEDRLSYSAKLNASGLARLAEGIRLHLRLPGSKLIFSGHAGNQPLPEAVIAANAAQELGIQSNNIITNSNPWNTKSEAAEYFRLFGTAYKLYLVTDAAHMPRALMHFRNAGLNPAPAPTNFNIRKNSLAKDYTYFLPSTGNIQYMEIVFQEYLGMLWAKMGGN